MTAVRAILNYRANRIDRMLARPELAALTCKRIRLEQRQDAHIFLSGMREPRLADAAVTFTTLFRLRSRYLTPWRSWLEEREGLIIFREAAWKRAWRLYFYVSVPGCTLAMLFLSALFASDFGIQTFAPFLLINALVWWFPWVTLTAIPFPNMTLIMTGRVDSYNARRAALQFTDS